MGYHTSYTLTAELLIGGKVAQLVDDEPIKAVIAQLRAEFEEAKYALDELGGCSGEETKWYEHTADMKAFSVKHPYILFQLHGDGEESGDIWSEYYLDGKVQIARAVVKIDAFDAAKRV